MKRFLHFVIFSFVIAFLFTGKSFSQGNNADTIYIGSNDGIGPASTYFPTSITVAPGDSILFICIGSGHPTAPTTTANGTAWATPIPVNLTSGQQKQVKINSTVGTYNFYCQIHNPNALSSSAMYGTINVSNVSAINSPKENKFEFSAAPNPFEDQLSMNINVGDKNVTEVKIYDLIGKEVASVSLAGKTGFHSYRVDTSNLKAGIYFCTVYSANGILETKKLFRRN